MFLHVSVILSTGGLRRTPPGPGRTPPGPGRTPPPPKDQADTPPGTRENPPRSRENPPGTRENPLGPGRTPPDQGEPPRPGRHPPGTRENPPSRETPPREEDCSIRSMSGRYASYWNAFLSYMFCKKIYSAVYFFFQPNDYATRKASPHSQQTLSDQNVECMVLYEPHDLNASLSSGSDKGSHTGSGSGSGSSRYVSRRTNRLNKNNDVAGQKYNHSRHHSRNTDLPGSPPSTSNANSVPLSQLATESKPSIYAHGDYGSPSHSSVNY